MALYTLQQLAGREIAEGELLYAVAVNATNIVRDVREMVTNTFGGPMRRYEDLTREALKRAIADLESQASAKGYDGVLGVRIEHPKIVEGGVGVVIYGTGFRFAVPAEPQA